MNSTRNIYDLHLIDERVREKEARLAEVIRKLADEEALSRVRGRTLVHQKDLDDARRKQRNADDQVSDIEAKLTPLEKKAYGGTVTNPRELAAMEQEAKLLKKRLGQAEETSLLLMDEVERGEGVVAKDREELAALEEERKKEVKALSAEKGQLEAQISELISRRQGVVSGIDVEAMKLYESLRTSRGGLAVALMERGMCQVCRISLPMGIVQRARAGREVAQCPSCGRILFST